MITRKDFPKPGTAVKFGAAIVLKVERNAAGDIFGLFLITEPSPMPFVTWYLGNDGTCPISRKYDGNHFSVGTYSDDLTAALFDYDVRIGKAAYAS